MLVLTFWCLEMALPVPVRYTSLLDYLCLKNCTYATGLIPLTVREVIQVKTDTNMLIDLFQFCSYMYIHSSLWPRLLRRAKYTLVHLQSLVDRRPTHRRFALSTVMSLLISSGLHVRYSAAATSFWFSLPRACFDRVTVSISAEHVRS